MHVIILIVTLLATHVSPWAGRKFVERNAEGEEGSFPEFASYDIDKRTAIFVGVLRETAIPLFPRKYRLGGFLWRLNEQKKKNEKERNEKEKRRGITFSKIQARMMLARIYIYIYIKIKLCNAEWLYCTTSNMANFFASPLSLPSPIPVTRYSFQFAWALRMIVT